MFDIENIKQNPNTKQWICCCQCDSPQDAEYLCVKYTMLPKQFDIAGEIYSRGSTAIIGTSNLKAVTTIASCINANYFMSPLEVYVFYGSNQKGLESRWCVGLDITNATKLIDLLNRQGSFINADNSPQNWFDNNGTSYSVVMLTGVLEQEQSEKLEKSVDLCLTAIENVTARKLTIHTIQ